MVKYDAKTSRDTDRSYLNPEIIQQRLKTLEALALNAGESVLDAGCGSGLLSELMSAAVGADGRVTGLDFSQDMLDLAAARCEPLGNVDLARGSVTQLDFESDSFDAASCIQTLLYVKEVETAICELFRVLKPGGRIAVLETDWRGVVVNSSDHQLTRRIFDAWDATVASPNLPTRLNSLLANSGFSAIRTRAIPVLNTSFNADNFGASMLKYMANNAVKQQVVDKAAADAWLGQFAELGQRREFFFCINRFLFTAVK